MSNYLSYSQNAADAVLNSFANGNRKLTVVYSTDSSTSLCIGTVAEN